jgi:hypothetical protein
MREYILPNKLKRKKDLKVAVISGPLQSGVPAISFPKKAELENESRSATRLAYRPMALRGVALGTVRQRCTR